MKTAYKILMTCVLCLSIASCVPTRKYDSMRAQVMRYESELDRAARHMDKLEARNDSLFSVTEALASDTARLASQTRELNGRYAKLLADGSAEAARMLRQLEQSQSELEALYYSTMQTISQNITSARPTWTTSRRRSTR